MCFLYNYVYIYIVSCFFPFYHFPRKQILHPLYCLTQISFEIKCLNQNLNQPWVCTGRGNKGQNDKPVGDEEDEHDERPQRLDEQQWHVHQAFSRLMEQCHDQRQSRTHHQDDKQYDHLMIEVDGLLGEIANIIDIVELGKRCNVEQKKERKEALL